jgi:hypothetical protein
MEHGFGVALPSVRVHTDGQASRLTTQQSASAVAFGEDIAFAPEAYRPGTLTGDMLIAHELAHTLQQGGSGGALSTEAAEQGADQAALRAVLRTQGGDSAAGAVGLAAGSGLALRRCSRSSAVEEALDGRRPFTPALATQGLDHYRGLSDGDRQRLFDRYYPGGAFNRLLQALPAGAAAAGGAYNEVIQDILRRAQRRGVLESAAASGLPNEAQMAQAQANLMQARNTTTAQAGLPLGAVPTTAQVAAQQSAQVAQSSIPSATSTMSPAQEAACNASVATAITTVVTYAGVHHPELHLVAADFHADCRGIENRGSGVIAYGDTVAGRRVAVVGNTFVRYVNANPAYAVSVVVHELFGHPEYGPYGSPGVEYGLGLYDRASALMPGYTQPSGDARTSEIDAYGYQETEIYSVLRSLPYHTNLAPADAALQANYVDPEPTVVARLAVVQGQWEPRIAKGLVRGMYQRFRLDPRLTPAAVQAFIRSVRARFPAADAADILR